MHHVGIPGHGRLPFLQPAGWKDGWPWIGADVTAEGVGQVAWKYAKPHTVEKSRVESPQYLDHFDTPALGVNWRFNHNPDPDLYSLTERRSWLRLYASLLETRSGEDGVHQPVPFEPDSILFSRNTLIMLPMGKNHSATTLMDVSGIQEGQRAGLCLFNKEYGWIGIVQENSIRRIQVNLFHSIQIGEIFEGQQVWLRAICEDGVGCFYYSLDGQDYKQLGSKIQCKIQWFENHKYGLFTYNPLSNEGYIEFDWFLLQSRQGDK
jgi:beta-xylosidase